MKRVILLLYVIVFSLSLLGCGKKAVDNFESGWFLPIEASENLDGGGILSQDDFLRITFRIDEGSFRPEHPEEFQMYTVPIPNKETALDIAVQLFEGLKKEPGYAEHFKDYIPQVVTYYEGNGVWLVSFWKPFVDGIIVVGDSYEIALRESDGKVLEMSRRE